MRRCSSGCIRREDELETAPTPAVEPGAPRAASQGGDAGAAVGGVQGGPSRGDAVQLVLCAVPGVGREGRRGDALRAPRRREDVRRLRGAHRRGGRARHRRASRGADLRRGARGVELHLRRGDLDAGSARLDRLARTRVPVYGREHGAANSGQSALGGQPCEPLRARHQPHLPRSRLPITGWLSSQLA